MTDKQIFNMMVERTGMIPDKMDDYRPCNRMYVGDHSIPTIYDAITVLTKDGDTVIFIPKKDEGGNEIERKASESTHPHIFRVVKDNVDGCGSCEERYVTSDTGLTASDCEVFANCLDEAKAKAEEKCWDADDMISEAARQFKQITEKVLTPSEYPFEEEFSF